ncbi:MAG: hypothetical protein SOV26_02590 [Candidatus Onthovivens sp.]|nr:hypothetical protein [Candidatus Onthovivens sp.]
MKINYNLYFFCTTSFTPFAMSDSASSLFFDTRSFTLGTIASIVSTTYAVYYIVISIINVKKE